MGDDADHADEWGYDYECKWCDGYVLPGRELCEACHERGKPPLSVYEPKPLNHQQRQKQERKMAEQRRKNKARMRNARAKQTPEQKQFERDKNKLRMRESRSAS